MKALPLNVSIEGLATCTTGQLASSSGAIDVVPLIETTSMRRRADAGAGSWSRLLGSSETGTSFGASVMVVLLSSSTTACSSRS